MATTPTKQVDFRVFGDVFDRDASFVDVEVSGVSETATIFLQESGGTGDEWEMTAEEIAAFHDDLLMVGSDNIPFPDHEMWALLEDVGRVRASVEINNFVDAHLFTAQESLFKALMEAGR